MLLIKNEIICSFDRCGNIYFGPLNDTHNLYELWITGQNTIYCDKFIEQNEHYNTDSESDEENNKIIKGQIISFANSNTLRGKIMKKINDETEEIDPNAEYDSDDDDIIQKTYFPEDNEFNEYIDDPDQEDNCLDNFNMPTFSFCSDHKKIKLTDIDKIVTNRDDHMALYETLIYEGSPEDASLLFKTKLLNDTPIYRLFVYTNGNIIFRPIGEKEFKYQINYKNDSIIISQVI
jgi:hypothetical protein